MRTTFPVSVPPAGWSALADPTRLAAALPGCRSVEADGDGTLTVVTDVSVASALGLWAGTVTLLDEDAVRIAGSGAPGEIDVTIRANPARTTCSAASCSAGTKVVRTSQSGG